MRISNQLSDEVSDIAVGTIVKWWTRYADDIIREAGHGLVLNVNIFEYQSATQDRTIEYKNFDVYRFKFNDIMSINERDVEILKE